MCTLSLVLDQSSRHPLIVAANRDESSSRDADPPHIWSGRTPRLIAGRDQRAGGTWMGLNEHGIFAGLTNLWDGTEPDPGRRSRGEAVLDVLEASSLELAMEKSELWDAESFNPFILVVADFHGNGFWCSTGDGLHPRTLEPGIHSFGNRLPDHPENEKLVRARRDLARVWQEEGEPMEALGMMPHPGELADALERALGQHHGDRGPNESLCVHTEEGFGTVSATLLVIGEERPREGLLWYSDGPPCTTRFTDMSGLLGELFAG